MWPVSTTGMATGTWCAAASKNLYPPTGNKTRKREPEDNRFAFFYVRKNTSPPPIHFSPSRLEKPPTRCIPGFLHLRNPVSISFHPFSDGESPAEKKTDLSQPEKPCRKFRWHFLNLRWASPWFSGQNSTKARQKAHPEYPPNPEYSSKVLIYLKTEGDLLNFS